MSLHSTWKHYRDYEHTILCSYVLMPRANIYCIVSSLTRPRPETIVYHPLTITLQMWLYSLKIDKYNRTHHTTVILFARICILMGYRVRVMVLNVNFNNMSVISWRSVFLVEETECPKKITDPRKSLTNFSVSSTSRLSGIRTHNVSGDRN